MARIYIPPEDVRDGCVALEGETLHHVRTVLRLRVGDLFMVTDGAGAEYAVRLERLNRDAGRAAVLVREEPPRESPLRTILAQAVPKGDRFAFVVQKAVEMGVTEILPLVSRRTVAAWPGRGEKNRLERWRRIAEAAVGQSGRTRRPLLHYPRTWEDFLAASLEAELSILLWEGGRTGLKELLDSRIAPRSILVAVGPEGGWSEEEVEQALRKGFRAARLGPRILRTETVGLTALAVLQYLFGDLG